MDPIQAEIDALLQPPGAPQGASSVNGIGGQLQQLLAAPREQNYQLMRGPDGKIGGAKIGDRLIEFSRGQDGRIAAFRLIDSGPSPQPPQPPAPPPPFLSSTSTVR